MKGLINFLLSLVGRLSLFILGPVLYLSGVILSRWRSKYFLNIGISYDQLGNVLGGPLFNKTLRKEGGARFGNPDETISFVLGKNKKINKLTRLGRWIADRLNEIDPGHVEKAKS